MPLNDEVQRAVMLLIDSCIDEQSLPQYSDSFVHMVGDVIHCDVGKQRFHYRVSLVPVNADPVEPGLGEEVMRLIKA